MVSIQKTYQSAVQLANRLCDLGILCMEGWTNPAEVMEAFTLDQFYNLINDHIACWVCDKKPKTVHEAGQSAG